MIYEELDSPFTSEDEETPADPDTDDDAKSTDDDAKSTDDDAEGGGETPAEGGGETPAEGGGEQGL